MNIEFLKNKLFEIAIDEQSIQDTEVAINARHRDCLNRSMIELNEVYQGLHSKLETDLIAQSLRKAIYELGAVTGEVSSDELLGNIFGRFCIGK